MAADGLDGCGPAGIAGERQEGCCYTPSTAALNVLGRHASYRKTPVIALVAYLDGEMLFIRLGRQIVEVPQACDSRVSDGLFEAVDHAGQVVLRCFTGDVLRSSEDRLDLVANLLQESCGDDSPHDWDGS